MKTENVHLSHLRGEEHFQFGEDVIAAIKAATPEALHVEQLYNTFVAVHGEEDEVLEQIRKSALTGKIDAADAARDNIFYGLSEAIRSSARHFTATIREAARSLGIPMNTYGNIATRNYAEQTAATYNLVQELRTNYGEEVNTLNLAPWLTELERLNNIVAGLLRQRDTENTGRTTLQLKEVRARADEAYRALINAVESLSIVAAMGLGSENLGTAAVYDAFIAGLNTTIKRYNNIIAVRRGHAKAKKEAEEKEKKEGKAEKEEEQSKPKTKPQPEPDFDFDPDPDPLPDPDPDDPDVPGGL